MSMIPTDFRSAASPRRPRVLRKRSAKERQTKLHRTLSLPVLNGVKSFPYPPIVRPTQRGIQLKSHV